MTLDATLAKTNLVLPPAESGGPAERVIAADWNQIQSPTPQLFHECIGAGRANEGLRAEWQRQLKLCQDKLVFDTSVFMACCTTTWGIFETKDGQPRHNWQYIDQLYDRLLAMNIRPFVELSFMPSALASGSKKIFWWQANVTPPKSYPKWDGLIRGSGRALDRTLRRGGSQEMEFRNLERRRIIPASGGRATQPGRGGIFRLYAHTAAPSKGECRYRVGGPAGAGKAWVRPMIEFCAAKHCRWILSVITPTDLAAAQRIGPGRKFPVIFERGPAGARAQCLEPARGH